MADGPLVFGTENRTISPKRCDELIELVGIDLVRIADEGYALASGETFRFIDRVHRSGIAASILLLRPHVTIAGFQMYIGSPLDPGSSNPRVLFVEVDNGTAAPVAVGFHGSAIAPQATLHERAQRRLEP